MAIAVVGSAFLSASLQVLFDRMASREFINFFRGRKHDETLLNKLKTMFVAVKPVLEDAEVKQWTNTAVKDWVDELKDAIYHADDLLDEIATEAKLSKLDSELPSSSTTTSQVSNLLDSWCPFGEDIESRIKQIIERLNYFVNAKDSLGLREVVGRDNLSSRLPTTCLVDQVSVYGRDDDKENIIQLLISDDDSSGHQINVIPIVGMGGIGKTTLAQLVYNDAKVDSHFDIKSWVCVSEELDIFRVTKTILEGLTRRTCYTNDLNLLQVDLKNILEGKKFIIVLDDVWNENYNNWEILRSPFADGKHGSKIIVTTRNKGVASIMRNAPIFHLEQLSNEYCWLLFSRHAFENVSPSVQRNLEQIGKKIVEKCKGLPLVAKTLGGLLRYKVEVEEWVNVLESHIWDLPKHKSDILPSLLLSYHHLPSHLKLCFAYCAIIPKDYTFEKDELVPLWIAEGFVQQQRTNRRIEDIGDDYFRELISISLFQQTSDNKFLMHDLINDLAQFVAGEYCFRLADDHPRDISKVRYFSYFKERFDGFAKLKAINEANCLRTFKPHHNYKMCSLSKRVLNDVLMSLRYLRVLSLSEYDIVELPDSIGNLIHLRYLDLSYTRLNCLPETISRLCNLQTLLLWACRYLTRLPTDLCKLICLRHLDTSGTNLIEMPTQIGRLTSLQRLTEFVVGNQSGSRINELRELHHLRGTLSISNLQNVLIVRDALETNLKNKKHLEELKLEWGAWNTDDSRKGGEVLDNLQPHINLKHLTIDNYGCTKFPNWLGDHSFFNLKSLCLLNCTNCFSLPPLGQLPVLQELTIRRMNRVMKVGSEFYGYDSSGIKPFQSLEKLTFEEMPEWEEWSILRVGEFYHLLELRISNCPKLIGEFPKQLPYLNTVELSGCQRLVIENILELDGTEHHYKFLQNLKISRSCDSLKSFPLGFFPKLRSLEINGCRNFESLSVVGWLKNLASLQSLMISSCPNMVSFAGGLPAPNLTEISIDSCEKLKSLPQNMCILFPSLQVLMMKYLSEIESFPSMGLPHSLSHLYILFCDKLMAHRMDWGLQRLPSLRECDIQGECEVDKLLESFPDEFLLPTSLTTLRIKNRPNLKSLNPNGLRHLNSLEFLLISGCPKLQSLPDEGLPSSLLSLNIWGCPLLKVRCQREKGEDWLKISHIPHIELDGEVIVE